MTSLRPIYRQAWRHAWRRPLQSLFLIVGVAIGVAMIVAIDLANGSAERAFQLGTETVTGKATHQITGGPSGLDEALYAACAARAGYRLSAPVVESYVVADALDGQPLRLLGVDPFAERPFAAILAPATRRKARRRLSVRVDGDSRTPCCSAPLVAERYGLAAGDTLTVRDGANRHTLTIAGLLGAVGRPEPARAGWPAGDRHFATAQEVLGKVGRLDRIDLIVPPGAEGEAVIERLSALLPPGARIDPTAARSGDRQRDDRGVSAQPDRAESAGAGGGHVSDLQHRHLQRRAAAACAGQPARAGHDARRNLTA
jgi:putative ABC transport system permease protein